MEPSTTTNNTRAKGLWTTFGLLGAELAVGWLFAHWPSGGPLAFCSLAFGRSTGELLTNGTLF